MKIKNTIISLIFIITAIINLSAQSDFREAPFQITLFPPLGTNGIQSVNTVNNISLNIIAGYNSGLTGVEFGGFLNINRDFVDGIQFAGFSNITGGETNGLQFAGFANINAGATNALQFSGFSNLNNGPTTGLQAAGFMNLTRSESNVVQLAGFGNFAHHLKGLQIAGFSNISSGDVNGAQIAGFINIARKVEGVQIGFINITDTIENGIPIGFLSIARNGFSEYELGFSEGLNTYLSWKIGVKQFYNIFSVGMQFLSTDYKWAYGYGLGTHLADSEDFKVNLELMSYQINDDFWRTNYYNGLQQVKLTFSKQMENKLKFYAGPTFNLLITDGYKESNFPFYTIFEENEGSTSLKFWFGFTAGLRL